MTACHYQGQLCPEKLYQIMKTSKFILPLSLLLTSLDVRAAEQDNWYLAKEWPVTESRGIYYDHNSTTGEGRIFVGRGSVWDNTGRDIKIYDTNGTLQNTFGRGNFMDLVMDEKGTLYTVSHNRVVAFSNSPGRVTSVTVDAPGSNLYRHWSNQNFTIQFSGGGGSGATAHAVLEMNSSDSDTYNKFVSSVTVLDGGGGYSSEPNATMRAATCPSKRTRSKRISPQSSERHGEKTGQPEVFPKPRRSLSARTAETSSSSIPKP